MHKRCELLLRRDSAFGHVRRLFIHGDLEDPFSESKGNGPTDGESKPRDVPFTKLIGLPYDGDDKSSLQSFVNGFNENYSIHKLPSRVLHRTDEFWKPLCRLIALLPGLADLIWNTEITYHHLSSRHFTSTSPFAQTSLIPGSISLFTSPLLYSVWVRSHQGREDGSQYVPSYTTAAVMELVARLAPNLKQVRFSYSRGGGNSGTADGNLFSTWQPWVGFQEAASNGVEERGKSLGALRYLELDGNESASKIRRLGLMQLWERSTDLSALRTLVLRQLASPETHELLNGLEITSLTLHYVDHDDPANFEPVQNFLRSLHRLQSLRILFKTLPSSLDVSACLTKLYLPEEAGLAYYRTLLPSMIEKCPLIEDCAVTIPRFRGGAPEVRLYRLIGSWPRLRHLALTLDASSVLEEQQLFEPRHVSLPQDQSNSVGAGFDDWDGQVRAARIGIPKITKRWVRNVMIDMAADESLALAIFEAISRRKQVRRDSSTSRVITALPLETLSVRVIGGGYLHSPFDYQRSGMNSKMLRFKLNMERSWRVTRDPRDDHRDVLHAVEVGRAQRVETEASLVEREEPLEYLCIFRRIWPERTRGSHWRDDWRSWPLESLEDE
ncbi:hypothetical protein C7999DRAFT_29953 [Corynascus novoguineensis]|uniref:Uncharacterized protein n=1 Tax=Corynascus novoguineensis TaxID=1126955 RepID=A0AAN7HS45_9PEZI|nr:hypothetical protein C7999DRAFT_29953 [Corynascus novoguineensis]